MGRGWGGEGGELEIPALSTRGMGQAPQNSPQPGFVGDPERYTVSSIEGLLTDMSAVHREPQSTHISYTKGFIDTQNQGTPNIEYPK